jgi:hypothetical protein
MSDALARALAWPSAKRSCVVAVIVGSILNAINQGDAMIGGGTVIWWKILLTYLVPFCVATYGAYSAFALSGGQE